MKCPKGYLYLLLLGAFVYLMVVYAAFTQTGGVGSRELLEIVSVKRISAATACYLVYVSLVIGYALTRHQAGGGAGLNKVALERSKELKAVAAAPREVGIEGDITQPKKSE